jgi:hypothetical protein
VPSLRPGPTPASNDRPRRPNSRRDGTLPASSVLASKARPLAAADAPTFSRNHVVSCIITSAFALHYFCERQWRIVMSIG